MTSAVGPGLTVKQLADRSFARFKRVAFINPRAASAAIMVASVDPFALVVGNFLTLLTLASQKFVYGRRITMTLNDAAGDNLVVSVLIKGIRWGRPQSETLTVTCTTTNDTVGTSALVYDQLTSVQLLTITNSSVGDTLTMGWDGTTLGMPFPVDSLSEVFSITAINAGTEQTPTVVSTTTFDVADSALIGLTIAATQTFIVDALIGNDDDGIGRNGEFA